MNVNEALRDRMRIQDDSDLIAVRQSTRALAQELGFGLIDQTKIVTATSELARNTLVHGGGGCVELRHVTDAHGTTGLRLVFTDRGPGIADTGAALSDGYSTASGMGMGLSGARRLVPDFEIETEPGEGTAVTITSWLRRSLSATDRR